MSFFTALVVFVVGFVSGSVTRWVAGLAAVVALVLVLLGNVSSVSISLVDFVVQRYYLGNELLFLSGFLFGIDAHKTRKIVVERR
ncbi:hypothetical protein ACFQH6_17715 [Halobacteriaceae archaeon GCM10025711]